MQESKKSNPMLGKTIRKMCTCYSPFQDRKYGKGVRVHNYCRRASGLGARCTVCGDVKEVK